MKILHTSDWHLGQKLLNLDRESEHRQALDWLSNLIREREIRMLIVAGDIFDMGNPPNYARTLYYRFLASLISSTCRHIVIVGGNHDSPSMLEAPRALLQALNVHVVASVSENPLDDLLVLHDEAGEPEAVVAAIPFLRDRDLRSAVLGETPEQRRRRIQEGILAHFRMMGEAMEPWRNAGIPLIATGHLYAQGAESAEKQDNIYLGDTQNLRVENLPEIFDYLAFGHIHRPQRIGGKNHVRYCGSLIPLSFSEVLDQKLVLELQFNGGRLDTITELEVPVFRRLKAIEGSIEALEERMRSFALRHRDDPMPPWIELLVQASYLPPNEEERLRELARELKLEVLKVRIDRNFRREQSQEEQTVALESLQPEEVFALKCEREGVPAEEQEPLILRFREIIEFIEQEP
jgi:exonuclease SbcD